MIESTSNRCYNATNGGERMVSRAKRQSNNKWDAANMKIVAAKIKKDLAEEFQRVCAENGDTMNGVIKAAIEDYIASCKK